MAIVLRSRRLLAPVQKPVRKKITLEKYIPLLEEYQELFRLTLSRKKPRYKTLRTSEHTYSFEWKGARTIMVCDSTRLLPLILRPAGESYDVLIDGEARGKCFALKGKAHERFLIGWNSRTFQEEEAARGLCLIGQLKKKKKKISKTLKDIVWMHWVGEHVATSPCYCCLERGSHTIYMRSFEAAHILSAANGGEYTRENLRPSCNRCNRGTATKSMDDFQRNVLNFSVTVSDPGYHALFESAMANVLC